MKDKNLWNTQGETISLNNKQDVRLVKENYFSKTFNKLLTLKYNDIMSKQIIR